MLQVNMGGMIWPQWLWPDDPFSRVCEKSAKDSSFWEGAEPAWKEKPPAVLTWLSTVIRGSPCHMVSVSVLETPRWRQLFVLERGVARAVLGWGWCYHATLQEDDSPGRNVTRLEVAAKKYFRRGEWLCQLWPVFLQRLKCAPCRLNVDEQTGHWWGERIERWWEGQKEGTPMLSTRELFPVWDAAQAAEQVLLQELAKIREGLGV